MHLFWKDILWLFHVAVCIADFNSGLESRLFLKSVCWATMAHQVLEEYNRFPITQATKLLSVETTEQVLTNGNFLLWW